MTQQNNTTQSLTLRSQPRLASWLTFDLKITPHERKNPGQTVVCLAFLPRPSFCFPFNRVLVATDGRYDPHDRAPIHLRTLAICTLQLMVRTTSAKWHDKAPYMRRHHADFVVAPGCTCGLRRKPSIRFHTLSPSSPNDSGSLSSKVVPETRSMQRWSLLPHGIHAKALDWKRHKVRLSHMSILLFRQTFILLAGYFLAFQTMVISSMSSVLPCSSANLKRLSPVLFQSLSFCVTALGQLPHFKTLPQFFFVKLSLLQDHKPATL